MDRLAMGKRVRIVSALVEGASMRSVSRMVGVSINTVTKLLVDLGTACEAFHDERVRGLKCQRIQCDEIWAFCYAKAKNVPEPMRDQSGVGDVWTWTALDSDTKLMVSWYVGTREPQSAREFMLDLAGRVVNRIQLTTDGHAAYRTAVPEAFGGYIDYAMLVKLYGAEPAGEARYSPPKCNGARKEQIIGMPIARHVSTSHIERSNLTMRMHMRRFTRLTNAFSKKFENHCHAVALHFVWYNFCRVHKTLRVTPALEAGLVDHVWELEELIGLLDGPKK